MLLLDSFPPHSNPLPAGNRGFIDIMDMPNTNKYSFDGYVGSLSLQIPFGDPCSTQLVRSICSSHWLKHGVWAPPSGLVTSLHSQKCAARVLMTRGHREWVRLP